MLTSLLSELPAGKVPAKPFYYPKRPGCVRWILVTFTRNTYRASPAVTGIALGKNITPWLGGLFHANADAHLRTLDFRAFFHSWGCTLRTTMWHGAPLYGKAECSQEKS